MTRTDRARVRTIAGAATAVMIGALLVGCTSSGGTNADGSDPAPSVTPTPVNTVPVVVDEIAQGDQVEPVGIAIPGPVQVNMREITLHPGGGTGKHCHYGNLIAVVQQGVFTHYAPTHPGGVQVYEAGESVIEGAGYVHEGKNEGVEDVVLWVTYVTPEGRPLAETDLAHCEVE